ncbi:Uma2 family endonuclease [Hymenobacter baengnokdamensis]|uniref:Uma2 family endonuclease n=1 Tax=Hymenobacter baengnokdamensis TaxID=2615203 RepID=UPI0012454246|nr:Uma2 family endonuclease [Hymenobacter baengnokdamensis]
MSAVQSIYQRSYTVEEYFAFEEQSAIRHEYYHGEIFPLDGPDSPESPEAKSGATKGHNKLINNVVFGLRQQLGERECEVFSESVRLAVEAGQYYNYPDIVVSCDPSDDDPHTVHRPVFIVEVLSRSTEAHDRGWKAEQYRQLPSLQQYVLITQTRLLVENYTRFSHDTWTLTSYRQLTDVLPVPALGLALSLADIYKNLHIPPLRLADQ